LPEADEYGRAGRGQEKDGPGVPSSPPPRPPARLLDQGVDVGLVAVGGRRRAGRRSDGHRDALIGMTLL
jgi:hypothetical protein